MFSVTVTILNVGNSIVNSQAFGSTFATRKGVFATFAFATFIQNGKMFKTQIFFF